MIVHASVSSQPRFAGLTLRSLYAHRGVGVNGDSKTDIKRPSAIRPAVLDKTVLMPAGLTLAAVIWVGTMCWDGAAEWTRRGVEVGNMVAQVDRMKTSIALMENELKYFRLSVERKLGPMPDRKMKGATDGGTPGRRRTSEENHPLRELGNSTLQVVERSLSDSPGT